MLRYAIAAGLLAVASSPVAANIVSADPAGFAIERTETIAATPATVWATLVAPRRWWSKDHTWSGDAANLSMDDHATGCFCETLPGRGRVEHARLIFVDKGHLLRMSGAFGPLQAMAVNGVLTFDLTPDGARATKVRMTYAVGGYVAGGLAGMAGPVDGVLGQQLDRLKAAAEHGPPAR